MQYNICFLFLCLIYELFILLIWLRKSGYNGVQVSTVEAIHKGHSISSPSSMSFRLMTSN